jgi:RNA polymerase sigma-70 factor (ECF subfamily)
MSESRTTGGSSPPDRREEFLLLLGPVYQRFENFVFAMTRDGEEARDLVAETLLRAYESFDRLKSREAFLSYLFSIASREAGRRRRRARWFGGWSQEAAEMLEWGGTPPDVGHDVELLYRALATLPHQQREAVVLFEIAGLSLREIQEIQGGTLSGVKVRIHRGRRRLAGLLGVEPGAGTPTVREGGGSSRSREMDDDQPIFFEAT